MERELRTLQENGKESKPKNCGEKKFNREEQKLWQKKKNTE